ncbi:MAG: translation initiation factor IF-2 [Metamycoplasmataceae bacterium]
MAKKQVKNKRNSNDDSIKKQLNTIKTELKDGIFIFTGPMPIKEFALNIKINSSDIIANFFKQGKMYNINHILTEEEIAEICFEHNYDFQKKLELNESNFMDHILIEDDEKDLENKPPIITIMGHVDHGKTTLIDFIRKSNITKNEKGGITQHTGAYQVKHKNNFITFLDTPGHEAFTDMRSRGAKITNIVILVVAADDGVMPQTIEAIEHSKAAKVPIIVFVNKMDKLGADPEKIKAALSKYDILSEDWGGNNQFIYGSGLTGDGVEKLFDAILAQSELLDLKSNPKRNGMGFVLESKVDKGKGVVATLIVENGTLNKRDFIVAGSNYGKIRTLMDTNDQEIDFAGPGTPVIITGINYSPNAGDKFICFEDEKFAKELANKKAFKDKMSEINRINAKRDQKQELKNLNIILKADVQGTLDALKYSILKLENEEISISIIRAAIGPITKSDILLAKTTDSLIYTFNLKIDGNLKKEADQAHIDIRNKSIIYEIIEDVQKILKKQIGPKYQEIISGKALIQKIFFYSKVGNIAGCLMTDGYMKAKSKINLYRNNKLIFSGKIDSLQQELNNVKEVKKGKEFGTHIHDFNDIQEGDIIEVFDSVLIED